MNREALDAKYPRVIETHGSVCYYEEHSERILAFREGQQCVEMGQLVRSNGRIGPEAGTPGMVVGFREPNVRCTNDVIEVFFKGETCTYWMKFKDLDLTPCVTVDAAIRA